MTPKETEGYEWTKGAVTFIGRTLMVGLVIVLIFNAIRWQFGLGMDDSDTNGFNRSGFRVLKDAKTGIEYLSDGHGGLVKRETK